MNLGKQFIQTAQAYGELPAITFKGQTITYQKFAHKVIDTIELLKTKVQPGDKVCSYATNRTEILSLYLATAALGGIFIPLNAQLTSTEVADILERTKPKFIYLSADLESTFRQALTHTQNIYHYAYIDGLAELNSLSGVNYSEYSENLVDFDEEKEALIIFTSGSTGVPKGVVATHLNESASTEQYKAVWNIGSQDKVLISLPMSFLYGLTTGSLTCLFAGAHVFLEEKFHPLKALEVIKEKEITLFMGVPTMYNMMLNAVENQAVEKLSSIRLMLTAGSPISEKTIEQFKVQFGIQIMNFYALSEVRPVLAYNTALHTFKKGSCGQVAPSVEVKIIDEDNNEIREAYKEGELIIKSNTLFKEYYNDSQQTAQVLKDGWFYTGDLVMFDEEGYFYIVGRKKELIIRGGINIAPSEIEECISKHEAVYEVAVIGVNDETFGEKVGAVLALKEGRSLSEEQLKQFVKEHLAEFKVPEYVCFLQDLPKNGLGKVDKKKLKASFNQNKLTSVQ